MLQYSNRSPEVQAPELTVGRVLRHHSPILADRYYPRAALHHHPPYQPAASSPQSAPVDPKGRIQYKGFVKSNERKVGELERLGRDGRDFLVLGLDAPGFDDLDLRQKTLAYYLCRAAIAGHLISDQQNHRFGLEIRDVLEQIHLHSNGLDRESRDALLEYLKFVWINHGVYDHDSHRKTLPPHLTPEVLRRAAEHACSQGARIEVFGGETLRSKLERLTPVIFEPEFEPLRTNQNKDDDIVATSAIDLYERGLRQADIDALPGEWKHRLNVRFAKENGRAVPQVFRIGGVYGRDLETVSFFLRKALALAENPEQAEGIEHLLRFYATGDEGEFRQYSIRWLRSHTVIDYLNGFIETYLDPRGVIGQFEGNVSFLADSTLVGRLADHAQYFERRMPWPDEYKRDRIERPVSNVVQVVVETGDAGPVSPAAYNLPNYSDLRRDHGSKNVILLNVEQSRSEDIRNAMTREFYLPEYRDRVLRFGDISRQWEVYMHEVIGHGSGCPAASLGLDPAVAIGRSYSALEECRADLVALYHVFDPKLVEIGAFRQEEQQDISFTMYVTYLQGQMNRYRMYEDDSVREAHQRGHQLVLGYLSEGGESGDRDFGVRVTCNGGNYYAELYDLERARHGVGEILGRLQTIKATGDASAADRFFDRFGSRVKSEWRRNIRERAARLNIPNRTAFVFPRLEPVVLDGKIVNVRLLADEDLETQQLRMSRLRMMID
jgi:dipeptidyl-peptidase III